MSDDGWPRSDGPKNRNRALRIVLIALAGGAALLVVLFLAAAGLGMYLVTHPYADPSPVVSPTGPLDLPVWVEVVGWDDRIVACEEPDDDALPGRCAQRGSSGEEWVVMSPALAERFHAQVTTDVFTATEACLPATPLTCFRVIAGGLGVEQTIDGGRSWRVEWEVSQAEAARRLLLEPTDDDPPLESLAVAVLEVEYGYIVGVVSGRAGFALRDTSGTWNLDALRAWP